MAAGWTDCGWCGCCPLLSFGLCADISPHWCHWCSVDGNSYILVVLISRCRESLSWAVMSHDSLWCFQSGCFPLLLCKSRPECFLCFFFNKGGNVWSSREVLSKYFLETLALNTQYAISGRRGLSIKQNKMQLPIIVSGSRCCTLGIKTWIYLLIYEPGCSSDLQRWPLLSGVVWWWGKCTLLHERNLTERRGEKRRERTRVWRVIDLDSNTHTHTLVACCCSRAHG